MNNGMDEPMKEPTNPTPGDDMLQPCDRALLVLYGEDDGSAHDLEGCCPCQRLVDQATEVLDAYRGPIAGAATTLPADLRSPPAALLQSLPRRRARMSTFAAAAGLVLLAASGTVEGTKATPAFALTDREIFWSLSFLYTDWDTLRSEPFWYEAPFLDDLDDGLLRVADDLRVIEACRAVRRVELRPREPSWDDLAPDALRDTTELLNRRIHETRRELEEWI